MSSCEHTANCNPKYCTLICCRNKLLSLDLYFHNTIICAHFYEYTWVNKGWDDENHGNCVLWSAIRTGFIHRKCSWPVGRQISHYRQDHEFWHRITTCSHSKWRPREINSYISSFCEVPSPYTMTKPALKFHNRTISMRVVLQSGTETIVHSHQPFLPPAFSYEWEINL